MGTLNMPTTYTRQRREHFVHAKKKKIARKKHSAGMVDYGKRAKINYVKIIIYTASMKYSAKAYHIFSCGCKVRFLTSSSCHI